MIRYMLITNEPDVAQFAWENGVERIFVDLELRGKEARQGHLSTVISRHSFDDVASIRKAVPDASLLVRLNPLWDGSEAEIARAIDLGADILMLPMFSSAAEVAVFGSLIRGRAKFIPLIETARAASEAGAIAEEASVDEIFVGLNDLHLDLRLPFMFTPLANGLLDRVSELALRAGKAFGFGGVARVGEGDLPGEFVIGEHVRLGSSAVILSRTFMRDFDSKDRESRREVGEEIEKLRVAERRARARDQERINNDRARVVDAIRGIERQRTAAR